jgi:hypothetical protein
MRSSRLRNWDSKVTFFAFADVITSVSGMLIFITLILATDLERPTESSPAGTDPESEQRLQETLRQQVQVDAENRRLQDLLSAAETAPASEMLESDISRLRSRLDEETRKQKTLSVQLTGTQAAILARDKSLGLTGLKGAIDLAGQGAGAVAEQDAKARVEMAKLEQQVSQTQSRLLKARQREGQLWIIPGKGTDKEPIFVTVAGSGVIIDRFDHPEQRRHFESGAAEAGFEAYLRESKPLDQYVVFEIRPSGIALFQDLVKAAREKGFEVGFDALEENRQIHLSTPPPLDEPAAPTNAPSTAPEQAPPASAASLGTPLTAAPIAASVGTNPPQSAGASIPPHMAPKVKSWWQRFLQWIGFA